MKKIFFLSAIFICLFASNISDEILLIESKLYPKIIYLMDDNEKKEKINIAIVINNNTKSIGLKLKKLMNNNKLKIDLIKRINLKYDVYIFATKKINKKTLLKLLKNKKILFTVYPNNVKNAIFGLFIGSRVYLYINPVYLNISGIKFNPVILKVGKIYEK